MACTAGVYVMSPWIDTTIQQLTAEGDSWQRNQGFDYLGFALGASPSALIFGEHPHPLDNLLKLPEAVLAALPPMLIQVRYAGRPAPHRPPFMRSCLKSYKIGETMAANTRAQFVLPHSTLQSSIP